MVVLGLDPGIARTGFGIVRGGHTPQFLRCGCLTTPQTEATADRLKTIGDDLATLIATANPDVAVVETVFFGANTKTAMLTAETRGVLLYVLRHHRIPVHNLTPLQIKSRLTGYGQASKSQMQSMVRQRLGLSHDPEPDDAADGLAAALCIAYDPLTANQAL